MFSLASGKRIRANSFEYLIGSLRPEAAVGESPVRRIPHATAWGIRDWGSSQRLYLI